MVPVSRRARKAIAEILNLILITELFFSHKVNFYAKFNAYTLLSFEIQIIKNGLSGFFEKRAPGPDASVVRTHAVRDDEMSTLK